MLRIMTVREIMTENHGLRESQVDTLARAYSNCIPAFSRVPTAVLEYSAERMIDNEFS